MEKLLNLLPVELVNFVLISLFSLLIGLSQRKLHKNSEDARLFGTDRTFTFIGILGYILYIIDSESLWLFGGGGLILSFFLLVHYYFKVSLFKDLGLTSIIIALITYCIAPLVITQPAWLYILVVVTVLIFTELKETFINFSEKIDRDEFITLGKFLIIAGIILPIVPDKPFTEIISLTPYRIWLAVVVISSISYLSYIIKKFIFPKSGIVLSGILGGLYSSTATTIILSRKSRQENGQQNNYASAIVLSSAMMYLRIAILMLIFNISLFKFSFVYFTILFFVSLLTGFILFIYNRKKEQFVEINLLKDKNPLEFKVALIFMLLFVAFSFLTYFALQYLGNSGLHILSFIVGVTDIDPFLITLFGGKYNIGIELITIASMQAIISNNFMKLLYTLFLSSSNIRLPVLIGLIIINTVNVILLLFI